jgi:predicted phage terminase large subunit-like protein
MRKSLEGRYNNSPYWQSVVKAHFTETSWEFTNIKGETLLVNAYGAQTGIRGTRTSEDRPQLALLDDLLSDKTGKSPVEIANIENTVYAAVTQALHPKHRKIIWAGTPFNSRDPLYKAVASGAWDVELYPVCEKMPCTEENYKGSWEDRFDYNSISTAYYDALAVGHVDMFNRELLLQIISNDNRLVATHDVRWFSKNGLLKNKGNFNFYITTDFATSEKTSADFSVVMVWALNANGDWYLVDGYCRKQTMDKNIDNLFTMVSAYKPMSVGVEVSGQQGGFLAWMRQLMIDRNIYFNFARQPNSNTDGIRPTSDKFSRFNQVVPLFKAGKVFFPEELIEDPLMVELLNELHLVSTSGIKSSHDDVLDAISMLGAISVFRPSEEPIDFQNIKHNEDYKSLWGADIAENNDSNIVSRYL